MQTHAVTDELIAVLEDLPPDRQRQLLKLARAWRKTGSPPAQPHEPATESPLVERGGLLLVSAKLAGAFVDHREIREEYLDKVMGSVE